MILFVDLLVLVAAFHLHMERSFINEHVFLWLIICSTKETLAIYLQVASMYHYRYRLNRIVSFGRFSQILKTKFLIQTFICQASVNQDECFVFNSHAIKNCCVIYFEQRNDIISIVKLSMENTSRRQVSFVEFDGVL